MTPHAAQYQQPARTRRDQHLVLYFLALAATSLFFTGCKALAPKSEKAAQEDLRQVSETYRPHGEKPALPELDPDSGLSNYLTYALLNQPRVASAYHDWAASVERITVERSLPDPTLGFQSDISDVVMTVMPGIMQMFPGPGKLRARANLAAAESQTRYFMFESAVLEAAFDLKRSFYELHFLDERIRINEENLALLTELEQLARAQNEAGKVTLQDVLRAQIERDRVEIDLANLRDSRRPLTAAFKGALGMTRAQPDPPVPTGFESTPLELHDDALLELAFNRNPKLKAIESNVRTMQADIAVAYKENVPDFSLGVMADVKANPIIVRPLAGMTVPIWRDKIAAGVARAKARELSAQSRLTQEQIELTVMVAEKTFRYRELTRNFALLQNQLIPKAGLSVDIAQAGYLSGQIDFFNLIDAQRQHLALQLEEVEARTRREIVLAELSLLIAGLPPEGAPLLNSSLGFTDTE